MADKLAAREPGEDGSMQGQIKTPMCSKNVQNKGDGKVHSFAKTMNLGGGSGQTDGKIEGPGAKGDWSTQKTIKGSNVSRKY